MVALQLEREAPLPLDDLVWDFALSPAVNGAVGHREASVLALRRATMREYEQLLVACGIKPTFTLGLVANAALCSETNGDQEFAVLDLGRSHSELGVFRGKTPVLIRTLSWSGDYVTSRIAGALGINDKEAEKLKLNGEKRTPDDKSPIDLDLHTCVNECVDELAQQLRSVLVALGLYPDTSLRVHLTGSVARLRGLRVALESALSGQVECFPEPTDSKISSVTRALIQLEKTRTRPGFQFSTASRPKERPRSARRGRWIPWAVASALLVTISFSLRYYEPFVRMPKLQERIGSLRSRLEALPDLDPELGFFESFAAEQIPYLECLAALAKAAQPGTMINEASLNRSGEASFKGVTKGADNPNQLRSRLLRSGYFSSLALQELTPTPDKKTWTFHLLARVAANAPLERPPTDSATDRPPEVKSGDEIVAPEPTEKSAKPPADNGEQPTLEQS